MANIESVVPSLVKLPLDQQILFRIKDMPETFLRELKRLKLVLHALQESTSYLRLMELWHKLHNAAADLSYTIFGVIFHPRDFSFYWLQFIDSLSITLLTEEALRQADIATWRADFVANLVNEAHEEMVKFGQDIMTAAQQISAALTNSGNTALHTALIAQRAQIVIDLLDAVNECDALFLPGVEYFREVVRRLQDIKFLESNLPSEEGIETARQRWKEFWTFQNSYVWWSGIWETRSWLIPKIPLQAHGRT